MPAPDGVTGGPLGQRTAVAAALLAGLLSLPACRGYDPPPAEAAARATADAAVRRISSGNLPATPTPSATPWPRPRCPDAVWWYEAPAYVGQRRAVEGTVVHTRLLAGAGGPAAVLDLGQSYPDPSGFQVLLTGSGSADAAQAYAGKTVCATGRLRADAGAPLLTVEPPDAIVVVE